MQKFLLIFGADGTLGKVIVSHFMNLDYDKIFLFDRNYQDNFENEKIKYFQSKDLSVEINAIEAMNKVSVNNNVELFLISTIGGYDGGKYFWEEDIETNKMMEINFKTNFNLLKHFALKVKESNSGSAIFISALSGIYPTEKSLLYSTSKAALNSLIKAAAIDGREINLTVNGIAPSILDTPSNREMLSIEEIGQLINLNVIADLIATVFKNKNMFNGNILELKSK